MESQLLTFSLINVIAFGWIGNIMPKFVSFKLVFIFNLQLAQNLAAIGTVGFETLHFDEIKVVSKLFISN